MEKIMNRRCDMNSEIIRLMTDEDMLEGMRIRLTQEGFREKTVNELLGGAKKIIEACPRERLCRAVFAEQPEKEIRPLLDNLFPYMAFNRIGWYGVALRILGDSMREIASNELNEADRKRLAELDAAGKANENTAEEPDSFAGESAAPTKADRTAEKAPVSIAAKKAARKLNLPYPKPEDGREMLASLRNDPEVIKGNAILKKAIEDAGRENKDAAAVLAKIEALTALYGPTGMNNAHIAEQIVACHIDEYLENGDEGAVEILARTLHDGKRKSFYLFAVRYCSAHNFEKYPFYNAATARALKYCREYHGFYNFSNDELLDYSKYKRLLDIFRKKYGMEEFSLSELSWLLTMSGKLLAGK